MQKIKILSCLIMLVSCVMICEAQNKDTNSVIVPFILSDEGHIIIQAKVNGIEGNFIFDTGAGLNLITKKFADKLAQLKKLDGFFTGHRATGEALQADLWEVDRFSIGDFVSQERTFAILDMDIPIDGLISLTPFRSTPISIDFTKKIMTVEKDSRKKHVKGIVYPIQVAEFWGKAVDIFITVRLNNELTLQVNLDSGAGFNSFWFSDKYCKQLDVDTVQNKGRYVTSPFIQDFGNTYYPGQIKELSLEMESVNVKNVKATAVSGLIYEGKTGINWLGNKITIDIKKNRIIID